MEAEDYEAWKRYHWKSKTCSIVLLGFWLFGLVGMVTCFIMMLPVEEFVLLVVAVLGPILILKVPVLIYCFDKQYREPRCRAAGVDPDLYMLPKVPYLFLKGGMNLTPNRTWYVAMPQDATVLGEWGKGVKCHVHRDAMDMVLGKSWYLKTPSPEPEQGIPPFFLKTSFSKVQHLPDMVEIVLTDSPVVLHHLSRASWTQTHRTYPGRPEIPSISSRVQHQQEFNRNGTRLDFELPRIIKSDLPPSYEEAMQISAAKKSTTDE
ncbi:unnamed protein product [Darwinula stevensoni]|uniref:Transmembrane protein n=1 Tax=Darwinula stevensoni TaxID=69355 RepID=A0A7R8X5L3_9CRUS|nr:unnamed protein product [Darwinula stevensoni]CAG0881053.1 unnamed protein product [Darwinula stevensoni]